MPMCEALLNGHRSIGQLLCCSRCVCAMLTDTGAQLALPALHLQLEEGRHGTEVSVHSGSQPWAVHAEGRSSWCVTMVIFWPFKYMQHQPRLPAAAVINHLCLPGSGCSSADVPQQASMSSHRSWSPDTCVTWCCSVQPWHRASGRLPQAGRAQLPARPRQTWCR
jgi:hypothetical protein